MDYYCSECGLINQVNAGESVICKYCGARILYKIRPNIILEYEAK
nr:DNA-directed RNA polymerases I, II and III [Cryptomonas paramecium]